MNQAVVGHGHVVPDGGDDLVPVYCPVPVSDEVRERIERARGERDLFLAFAELSIGEVERERTEFDAYEFCLSGLRASERRPVATFRHFQRFPQDFRGSLHLQHYSGNVCVAVGREPGRVTESRGRR